MSHDILRLNYNKPIHSYVEAIPNINQIAEVYSKLGINNYYDYIYGLSPNTQTMGYILLNNPDLQAKASTVVLADIIHQNAQLFGDLGEQLLKRLLRYSAPLFVSSILLVGVCVVEHLQPMSL